MDCGEDSTFCRVDSTILEHTLASVEQRVGKFDLASEIESPDGMVELNSCSMELNNISGVSQLGEDQACNTPRKRLYDAVVDGEFPLRVLGLDYEGDVIWVTLKGTDSKPLDVGMKRGKCCNRLVGDEACHDGGIRVGV